VWPEFSLETPAGTGQDHEVGGGGALGRKHLGEKKRASAPERGSETRKPPAVEGLVREEKGVLELRGKSDKKKRKPCIMGWKDQTGKEKRPEL